MFIGSADLMPRNLDKRVELLFPIDDEQLKERIFDMLKIMLKDTTNARIQGTDTEYVKVNIRGKDKVNSQKYLAKEARERLKNMSETKINRDKLNF